MNILNHIKPIGLAIGITFIASLVLVQNPAQATVSLEDEISGRILLQVEQNGEAWYLYPVDGRRYFLGRPADAFDIMRSLGLGISNKDIEKIPIGLLPLTGTDTDGDKLSDIFEDAINTDKTKVDTDGDGFDDYTEVENGFNPNGLGEMVADIDYGILGRVHGRILLQVEQNGEAWFINRVDGKRYFLGRPHDAFNVMRSLGLGITDEDLGEINIGVDASNWLLYQNEKYNYELNYPQGWQVIETSDLITHFGADEEFSGVNQTSSNSIRVYNSVNDLPNNGQGLSLDNWINSQISSGVFSNKKIAFVDNIQGVEVLDRGVINFRNILVQKVSYVYSITVNQDHAQIAIVDQIFSTFKFVNNLQISSPKGNEQWRVGASYAIQWQGTTSAVDITLLDQSQESLGVSSAEVWSVKKVPNTGFYQFIVPINLDGTYRFYISFDSEEKENFIYSDYFAIIP